LLYNDGYNVGMTVAVFMQVLSLKRQVGIIKVAIAIKNTHTSIFANGVFNFLILLKFIYLCYYIYKDGKSN